MTTLFERAVETARQLPPHAPDEIARVVLLLAGGDEPEAVRLSPEERAAIAVSRDAAARGKFATDAQVRAVWARHRL